MPDGKRSLVLGAGSKEKALNSVQKVIRTQTHLSLAI